MDEPQGPWPLQTEKPLKPIAFKVRGGGNYSGTKGGAVKPNEKGCAGYLGYEDKTFTIATAPDQWILAPITQSISNPMNEPAQPTPVGKPIRYLSVCSGMEAASVAWHPLGFKPIGFSEIEPFPCAILFTRYPQIPNYGSLTEYKQWPLEPGAIDLLVGGTPCQSFSVAGLRKGLDDPRGNLALVFLGLADKLKPRWIVWENVPGVLSSAGGRDFGSFLGALVELGYGFAYRVLDAQHFGVPQRRRRVFVVACLGDWRAPAEVLLESDCVRRDIKKGRAKGQSVAAGAEGGVDANGIQRTVGTLCADTHPGAYSGQDAYTGRLIPSHWDGSDVHPTLNQSAKGSGGVGASNQELFSQGGAYLVPGQPIAVDTYNQTLSPTSQSVRSAASDVDHVGGVMVPIPYRKSKRASSTTDNETWVEADASNTLNNFDLGDTRTTHAIVEPQTHCADVAPTVTSSGPPYSRTGNSRVEAEAMVVQPHIVQASELRLRGQITEQQTVPTLLANTKSGDNDPLAVHPVTFQPGNLRRDAGADPSTTTTTTLKASAGDQMPHVAYPVVPLDGMNLLLRLGPCGEEHSIQNFTPGEPSFTLKKGGNQHGVLTPMAVRRLTPVECERLQGFPDNWSRISWKGKPEDQCPDGPPLQGLWQLNGGSFDALDRRTHRRSRR